ncbi:MAG: hypothetical protein LE168_05250 [Endomicrobium sp.]|nr:hypothetical protein [Endomicrobium sp.]
MSASLAAREMWSRWEAVKLQTSTALGRAWRLSLKYMQYMFNEFTFRMNDGSFDGLLTQAF